MLPFFPFPLTQATPTPPPQEIVQPQEVRPLPGRLDNVEVFNSNSPEVVQSEGILLSTFPPRGKSVPAAHLNHPLQGQFDIFAHHIAKPATPDDLRTLYVGILIHNPGNRPITVDILQGASYLSQPDAPFIPLPSQVDNGGGSVYAGPGDRVTNELLRGMGRSLFPSKIVIQPKQSRLLINAPIPVANLTPPLNGRSTLIRLRSNSPVYLASLASYARQDDTGERSPTLREWQRILDTGSLVTPRDRVPTPPNQTTGQIIYGRVAGVARGSQWVAQLTDSRSRTLAIPESGEAFSYPLSTVTRGTLGTNQDQSAPMVVRYPDTAYRAHGNYGIQYSLSLPLVNKTRSPQIVTLAVQTPVKQDTLQGGLRFLNPPSTAVFFRGTIQTRYRDDAGLSRNQFTHLVQRRGQQGEPLVTLRLRPAERRLVQVDFLYPPDATPPQVLTVKTQSTAE